MKRWIEYVDELLSKTVGNTNAETTPIIKISEENKEEITMDEINAAFKDDQK